jgi:hypothetical protein
MSDDVYVGIVKITPENRDALVDMAMSMYLGEVCAFCGKEYNTLDDLKDTVWDGKGPACEMCWKLAHP